MDGVIAEEPGVVPASHRIPPTQDRDVTRLRIAPQMPAWDDVVTTLSADEVGTVPQLLVTVSLQQLVEQLLRRVLP